MTRHASEGFPQEFDGEAQLDDFLTLPSSAAESALRRFPGDILVLGAGGKMGPTLARMARRVADAVDGGATARRVIGVSRFSDVEVEATLNSHGVETIRGDLLEPDFVRVLPEAPNVFFLAGRKFGASAAPSLTWAHNVHAPALVAERFRSSRIVAFSTGQIYPFVRHAVGVPGGGGARETDASEPVGEYAMTALGRERMFEHWSRTRGTPVVLLRLNYATEMRYGVLIDIAQRVWQRQPVDIGAGHVNVIWQGDACAMALAALGAAATPPAVLNIAGPEVLSVRDVARELGRLMERDVRFTGTPAATSLLSDGRKAHAAYGAPRVSARQLLSWSAAWVRRGGRTLGKATHFEVRDGRF